MSFHITVKDRNEVVLATLPEVDMGITVEDFKTLFLSEWQDGKKLSIHRVRLTVEEQRGMVLDNPRNELRTYIDAP